MQVVTANRLIDGRVVFRGADGGWVETIGAAVVLEEGAAAAAVAASAADVAARLIVEPYAIDVATEAAAIVPRTMRERIRASGPTAGSEAVALAALGRDA
ncbi:DUF2849 domain-containing protein [Siculibacillus lacustris]|uniref:DUF2849 domain-containing protein n=1 Tax=Siculibacillus lacustris TaxID=1549641 RepID=A0A4Q9VMR0_9HYPH|nr:DUF2849 domain-containing protein [Siculibacillus lacustris]TBW35964.1 DUF2849 domain-containing protein [Siculibacillus lacustris]